MSLAIECNKIIIRLIHQASEISLGKVTRNHNPNPSHWEELRALILNESHQITLFIKELLNLGLMQDRLLHSCIELEMYVIKATTLTTDSNTIHQKLLMSLSKLFSVINHIDQAVGPNLAIKNKERESDTKSKKFKKVIQELIHVKRAFQTQKSAYPSLDSHSTTWLNTMTSNTVQFDRLRRDFVLSMTEFLDCFEAFGGFLPFDTQSSYIDITEKPASIRLNLGNELSNMTLNSSDSGMFIKKESQKNLPPEYLSLAQQITKMDSSPLILYGMDGTVIAKIKSEPTFKIPGQSLKDLDSQVVKIQMDEKKIFIYTQYKRKYSFSKKSKLEDTILQFSHEPIHEFILKGATIESKLIPNLALPLICIHFLNGCHLELKFSTLQENQLWYKRLSECI